MRRAFVLAARPSLEVLEGRMLPAVITWFGAAGGLWSAAGNWSSGTVPGANDDVIFNGDHNTDSRVDQGFAGTVRTIQIRSTYTSTIDLARNLDVGVAGATSTMAGGTINQAPTAQFPILTHKAGTFVWSGGTITGFNVIFKNDDVLKISTTTVRLDAGADVNNSGTATIDTGGTLDVKGGASILNIGIFNVNSGPITNSAGTAGSFTNVGTLNVSQSLDTGSFTNSGTATINAGGKITFTNNGSQSGLGASTIFNGGTMVTAVSPGYQVSGGSITTSANGTTVTGTITNTGATVTIGGTSTFTLTGNYSQIGGGTLSLTAAAPGTSGKLAVGANFTPGATLYVNFTAPVAVGNEWSIVTYGAGPGNGFAQHASNAHQYEHNPDPDQGNTYKIKITQLLRVEGGSGSGTGETLTADALAPIMDEATSRWTVFVPSAGADLANVKVVVSNLPDGILGLSFPGEVRLDDDAAGYGWFIDRTPADDSEFATATGAGELRAASDSPAYGAVDLLTVVLHEFGHQLGLGHSTDSQDVMAGTLALGMRRVPTDTTVANAVVDDGMGPDALHIAPAGPGRVPVSSDVLSDLMLGLNAFTPVPTLTTWGPAAFDRPQGRSPILAGSPLFDRHSTQQLSDLSVGGSSDHDDDADSELDAYFANAYERGDELSGIGVEK